MEYVNKKYTVISLYKISDNKIEVETKENYFIEKFKPALN